MSETLKRKMIPVNELSYEKIKEYCDKHGLKISKWVELILIKEIENEKGRKN